MLVHENKKTLSEIISTHCVHLSRGETSPKRQGGQKDNKLEACERLEIKTLHFDWYQRFLGIFRTNLLSSVFHVHVHST